MPKVWTMQFQFHKGTIKTVSSICLKIAVIYFNSIKVQLKRHRTENPLPVY